MPSWSLHDDWDDDRPADRYQAAIEREELERMAAGTPAIEGWRKPTDPVCPVCWWTIVDGECMKGCDREAA